jgi:hypothetical protein
VALARSRAMQYRDFVILGNVDPVALQVRRFARG